MSAELPAAVSQPADLVRAGGGYDAPPPARRTRLRVWKVIREQPMATFGAVVLLLVILVAIFAPALAPYGPREKVGDVYQPPDSSHWLGLDDGGVDMVTLLMYGARVSLIVGFAAAAVAMLVGGAVGVLSGYFGGKTDTVLMRITDYFIVIPDLPFAIIVAAVWGPSSVITAAISSCSATFAPPGFAFRAAVRGLRAGAAASADFRGRPGPRLATAGASDGGGAASVEVVGIAVS